MVTRAYINKEFLVWARKSVGYTEEEVAKSAGMSVDRYSVVEDVATEDFPTMSQLRSIANKLKRPLNLFFLPFVPKSTVQSVPDFRGIEGNKIPPAVRICAKSSEEYRDNYISLLNEIHRDIKPFNLSWSKNDIVQEIALNIRKELGVSIEEQLSLREKYKALSYWKSKFENAGVLLFQYTMPTDVFRGMSIYHDEFPIIILSSSDSVYGRIFSLFHELGHLGLRQGGICLMHYNSSVEVFCNKLAAETLLPSEHFLPRIGTEVREWGDDEISNFSRDYSVSKLVILRKILDAGRTTSEFYQSKQNLWNQPAAKATNVIVPQYRKVISKFGKSYIRTVFENYYSDKINMSDLSQMLGVKTKHLPKVEAEIFK